MQLKRFANCFIPEISDDIISKIIEHVTNPKNKNKYFSCPRKNNDPKINCADIDCPDCILWYENYNILKEYIEKKYKVEVKENMFKKEEKAKENAKFNILDIETLAPHQIVRCEKDGNEYWYVIVNGELDAIRLQVTYIETLNPFARFERTYTVVIGEHINLLSKFKAEDITHVFGPDKAGYFDGNVMAELITKYKHYHNEYWYKVYERARMVTLQDVIEKFGCPVIIKQ